MIEISTNLYIYALFAVLLVAVAGFLVVLQSMKDIEIEPVSIRVFRLYFFLASIGWITTATRDLAHIDPMVFTIGIPYFIVTALLFPAFIEEFRKGKWLYGLIISHTLLVLYQFTLTEFYPVILSIIFYTIVAYGYLFIRIARLARQYKNIGFALIASACFIVTALTPFELYYLVVKEHLVLSYSVAFIGTACGYILVGIGFISSVLISVHQQLLEQHAKLEEKAYKDPLTGLLNRRGFELAAEPMIAFTKRNKGNVSVVAVDIDYFKKINDNYGHDGGDEVLKALGKVLSLCPRESDICSRFGGEEFILLFPCTLLEDAVVIAERLRRVIAGTKIQLGDEQISVTASLGVASQSNDIHLSQLINKADEALYNAKEQGRNQVCSIDEVD